MLHVAKGADADPVVAQPLDNYDFLEWSDGVKSMNRQELAVTGDAEYTARFVRPVYTVSYTVEKGGRVAKGEATQHVKRGAASSPVLVAPASEAYYFIDWSDGGVRPARQEQNVQADASYTAHFGTYARLPDQQDFEAGMSRGWST